MAILRSSISFLYVAAGTESQDVGVRLFPLRPPAFSAVILFFSMSVRGMQPDKISDQTADAFVPICSVI
ncbi:MAG: hypothetical protein KDA88_12215 [Planctomycetaceae bacterium]|nr:hypothetical protein [Planctomycetaceae bacterium]MCB9949355.1 hypothetical protein [Planctomycetaceae bacterium]